ncbi:MAG: zinc ribbon domain-containing protein [Clostridia bacterium]|nr:zinc ribbon domain-containing protein [Clostridia bacterium]
MYCINCGAKLEKSEDICPLCGTRVNHPDIVIEREKQLYPKNRMPDVKRRSKAFNGAVIIIFLIPLVVSFLADFHFDKEINWFGYVSGALVMGYTAFALPLWFEKPNPVIFTPCVFAEAICYLLYINCITDGNWFLSFAFPVAGGFGLIATAVVTLLYYLKKGKLYIWGGAFCITGGFIMLMEFFISITFDIKFYGWSLYPLSVLVLLGGLMFYLAINKSAREIMERKLFF